ncbi:hypothetical protein CP02DC18_0280A, partial [Chlamydia psittaci 02DC18]
MHQDLVILKKIK